MGKRRRIAECGMRIWETRWVWLGFGQTGTGRTGRGCRNGGWPCRAPRPYPNTMFMVIRNNGHWEAWLKFFLKGVGEVSRSATETARQILELRQKHLTLIRKQAVNQANGAGLLDCLFEQPIVTARLVEERLGCAYMTADKLLKQFAELKIVKETTGGQRDRRFEFVPYLALFEPESVIH